MKITKILCLSLIGITNLTFGFKEEVKTLFSDAKVCISEKICKALAPKKNLNVDA